MGGDNSSHLAGAAPTKWQKKRNNIHWRRKEVVNKSFWNHLKRAREWRFKALHPVDLCLYITCMCDDACWSSRTDAKAYHEWRFYQSIPALTHDMNGGQNMPEHTHTHTWTQKSHASAHTPRHNRNENAEHVSMHTWTEIRACQHTKHARAHTHTHTHVHDMNGEKRMPAHTCTHMHTQTNHRNENVHIRITYTYTHKAHLTAWLILLQALGSVAGADSTYILAVMGADGKHGLNESWKIDPESLGW